MLHHLAHQVTLWLHQHPEWGGLVTFAVAVAESLAIVGVFVPALIFFTAVGALVSSGVLPLVPILLWAFAGAVLGDGVSYLLGYFYRDKLQRTWPFTKYKNLLDKGKVYFKKHGGKSVFVSRFIGPLRSIMPMVAGMMNMKPQKFFAVNIPSAIIWSPLYMAGGFLLGAAATSLSPHRGQHLVVVLGCALLIVAIAFLLLRWIISVLHRRLHGKLMNISGLQRIFHNAINLDHEQQTFLGLWGIVCLILFFIVMLLVMNHIGVDFLNLHTHDYFQTDRNPGGDKFFLAVALFGQVRILLPWVGFIVVCLFISKNWRTTKYFIGLMLTTLATIYLLKTITHYPRPGGLINSPSDFSFPSGHVVLGITLYGFIAYIIAAQFERQYHYWALFFTSVIVVCIAVSRLYLGVHWLSDIVGSMLLGLVLILIIIISYRRKPVKPVNLKWFIPAIVISLMVIYGLYAWQNFAILLSNYQLITPPSISVMMPAPILV